MRVKLVAVVSVVGAAVVGIMAHATREINQNSSLAGAVSQFM